MRPMVQEAARLNNLCGEGPIWDHRRQCLWWTDLTGKSLFRLHPNTCAIDSFSLDHMASAIVLDVTGALLLAGPSGLHLWEEHGVRPLCLAGEVATLPFNDMVADSHGRIYAGTLYLSANGIDVERAGSLLLIETDGSSRVVDEGFTISNGLSLSPDGAVLYHADTGSRRIYASKICPRTGDLSRRTEFVELSEDDGVPDGITVDANGHLWCALWFSGKVMSFDSTGNRVLVLDLPVSQVSSLAFGGTSLEDLFVTSASERWDSPLAPSSFREAPKRCGGSLYQIGLHTRGKLEHLAKLASFHGGQTSTVQCK